MEGEREREREVRGDGKEGREHNYVMNLISLSALPYHATKKRVPHYTL